MSPRTPRNLAKPDGSANFALESAGDERLSDWMDRRLTLATWDKTDGLILADIETALVGRLRPPLNLDKVGEPRERFRNARKLMAEASLESIGQYGERRIRTSLG